MFGRLFLSTDLKQFLAFASPAFFEVVPRRALFARARELLALGRDRDVFARAKAERRRWLERTNVPVVLQANERSGARGADLSTAERARAVTALYFHQLWHGEITLVDLRRRAFTPAAASLGWDPAAWLVRWRADFIEPLREVYRGFYAADNRLFRGGLRALGLQGAEDVLREHFGDPIEPMRFRVQHFVGSFHQVFERCRELHATLHPDFLALGLYLATLYDHLEQLGVPVPVADCFAAAEPVSDRDMELRRSNA